MEEVTKTATAFFMYLFTLILVVIGMTITLSLSWNNVMPYLFHLPTIDFGQAFALSWVCSSLFKPYVHIPEKKQ